MNEEDGQELDPEAVERKLDELLLVERILNAAMRDASIMERMVRAGVSDREFEKPEHGAIWRAVVNTNARYGKAEVGLVEELLRRDEKMPAKEAKRWLREIAQGGSVTFDDETLSLYIERLRHHAALRRLRTLSHRIHANVDKDMPVAEIAAEATREIESIVAGSVVRRVKTSTELVQKYIERLGKKEAIERVPLGLPAIDRVLRGGIRRGLVCAIGADTGVGKTTFGQHIARSMAMEGHRVAYFTSETPAEPFFDGIIEMEAELRPSASPTLKDMETITFAGASVGAMRIFVDDTESLTAEELLGKLHVLVREEDVDACIVDYGQDLERSTRYNRDDLNFAHISKVLRRGFARYNVAGVVLLQLKDADDKNRSHSKGGPMINDIAYTRQFAKDASYILMLDRMSTSDDEKLRNLTRVRLLKDRPERQLATTWIRYNPKTGRLEQSDEEGKRVSSVPVEVPDDWDRAIDEASGDDA